VRLACEWTDLCPRAEAARQTPTPVAMRYRRGVDERTIRWGQRPRLMQKQI
jgi:hypothetical protein